VTFACDLGERSASKLYNNDYLLQRGLSLESEPIDQLIGRYRDSGERIWYATTT
jgi:cysteine synthase A